MTRTSLWLATWVVAASVGCSGKTSETKEVGGFGATGATHSGGYGGLNLAGAAGKGLGSGGSGASSAGTGGSGALPGAVGEPCILGDEYDPMFSGYSVEEVILAFRDPQCESRICVSNHFQGRSNCPYGQDLTEPISERCKVPGGAQLVEALVSPQLLSRAPADTMHCSCRCANSAGQTNDGGDYCQCPVGTECTYLFPEFGFNNPETGYYCTMEGMEFVAAASETCVRSLGNCDDRLPP